MYGAYVLNSCIIKVNSNIFIQRFDTIDTIETATKQMTISFSIGHTPQTKTYLFSNTHYTLQFANDFKLYKDHNRCSG